MSTPSLTLEDTVENTVENTADVELVAAERSLVTTALIGCLIGMAAGAVVWVLMVVIAVALSGSGFPIPWWMGAIVGLFAGSFIGSWAGVMVRVERLEAAERRAAGP